MTTISSAENGLPHPEHTKLIFSWPKNLWLHSQKILLAFWRIESFLLGGDSVWVITSFTTDTLLTTGESVWGIGCSCAFLGWFYGCSAITTGLAIWVVFLLPTPGSESLALFEFVETSEHVYKVSSPVASGKSWDYTIPCEFYTILHDYLGYC